MKTILVAVDLTQDPVQLITRSARLADEHKAEVRLLHVIEEPPQGQATAEDVMRQQAHAALEALAAAADFPAPPTLHVECGVPHLRITQAAREEVDLLLIGPGRAASVLERVFGSTADRIVRTATVPVLVVRNAATGPYGHVAVAIDFSPLSQAALDAARMVAPSGQRMLVHVSEIPLQFEQAMLRVGTSPAEIERYRHARRTEHERQLAQFVKQAASAEVTSVLQGSPADLLADLAAGGRIDLLAIGSQGRNVVAQALLGSVARRLLTLSGCDLLIVGRRDAA